MKRTSYNHYQYLLIVLLFFLSNSSFAQFKRLPRPGGGSVSGDSQVNDEATKSYSGRSSNTLLNPNWAITGGTILNYSGYGTSFNVTVKWKTPGTQSLYLRNGSTTIATKTVTVYALPGIPPTPSISTNPCDDKVLTRSSPPVNITYYWQGTNSSGTSTTNSALTYTVSSSGTYYIRGRNSLATWGSSRSIYVTVNNFPSVPAAPSLPSINCGSAILTRSNPPSNVTWYWQGTNAAGTSTSNSLSTYSVNAAGTYYLRARSSAGCWSSTAVGKTVTLTPPSEGGTLSAGLEGYGSVSGSLTLSNFIGSVQKWQEYTTGWVDISETNNVLTYTNVTETINYRVIVKNGDCTGDFSSESTVIIYETPIIQASEQNISPGGTSVLSTSSVQYSYQWLKDGQDISGATGILVTVDKPGAYSLKVRGSSTSPFYETAALLITDKISAQNINYVSQINYLVEGMNTNTSLFNLQASDYARVTNYFDGLGRPMQTVLTGQSPNGYDIVQPVEYDTFGRQAKQFLPYIKTEKKGTFIEYLTRDSNGDYLNTIHQQFYAAPPANVTGDSRPFSETIFENSPLNRPIKRFGLGDNWFAANKYTESKYEINYTSDAVKKWLVANDMPNSSSTYAAGDLYKNVIIDEEGHQVQEFVNKTGQTILKRVQAPSPDNWADTYYIYDDFGNLRLVLPPEASKQTSNSPDAVFLKNWAFQYKYDGRQRMIEKQVPGSETVYMVYDVRDRLVLTQDGNQRLNDQWLFTKYDELNRPILNGFYTKPGDRTSIQSAVDGISVFTENRGNNVHGYTNNAYPNVSNENDYLTVTYYDNYAYPHAQGASANYDYAEVFTGTVLNESVKGLVTGTKTRVLDAQNTWLQSTIYYDDRYRVIQSIADNYLGGRDRASSKYDFIGNALEAELVHQGIETHTIIQEFNYDHANRLLSVTHKLNSDAEIVISANEYNELGELIDKNLHSSEGTNFEQSLDYRYNIRGWLTHINNANLSDGEGDYFGMELVYEGAMSGLSPAALYNGNIAAVKWKAGGSGDVNNAYLYAYDEMSRIKSADYKNLTNTVATTALDMSVGNYDLNGNIISLNRANANGTLIDQLAYTYNSGNQLSLVTDGGSSEEGFKDGNVGSDDYEYDANGNMVKDWNKDIQQNIIYNYLNLPTTVVLSSTAGDKKIDYIYDATGIKLAQIVTDGADIKRTDYAGGFIYEDDELQFIQYEEGRIIPGETTSDPFVYQYNLKDHLGNVRLSFTTVDEPADEYLATMEPSLDGFETDYLGFTNLDTSWSNDNYDHTDVLPETQYSYSARLNFSASPDIVGPAKLLEVVAGDQVAMEVYVGYNAYSPSNPDPVLGNDLIGAIAAAFTPVGATTEIAQAVLDQFNAAALESVNGLSGSPIDNAPPAFLNYILLDNDFKYIDAGYIATPEAAATSLVSISIPAISIKQKGYVYIYVSNETKKDVNVHFDDLKITHHKSRILQMDDYYPFGLTFNSYQRPSAKKNDWKFQGQEHSDETGWDMFKWRNHQPDIGRFFNVDPLAEKYVYNSPYAFSENKVVAHVELEGLESVSITNMASSYQGTPYEWGGKIPAFQGGLPQGMTHQWYIQNVGTPSSVAGGALWSNPNYSNEVNLSQYLSGNQNSCGIDCSGLSGTSFNADQEKLMGDFILLDEGVTAMINAFAEAEETNSGFLGTDFTKITQGDMVFTAGHVRVATGDTRTNESGEFEIEVWHAPQTGEYVKREWQVPNNNWSYGRTFRNTETVLEGTTVQDENQLQ